MNIFDFVCQKACYVFFLIYCGVQIKNGSYREQVFDTYNIESFFGGRGGGRLTLMEDISKVNVRLIPSIYFLVVYT